MVSSHLPPGELPLGEGQFVGGAVVQQVAGGEGDDVGVSVAALPFPDIDACGVQQKQHVATLLERQCGKYE